jgi:hypothetical protein
MNRRACHHCDEFTRASLLRQSVAQAGRGLPAIEPGMPLPAGTGLDRRAFVSRTVGMALTVYGASALRPAALEEGIARAAVGGAGNRVLVSVFMPGGTDALSVLYPPFDGRYRRLRPDIALKASEGPRFREDGRLHWHPSLKPLAQLHKQGKVTVFPSIGYTHPDQSHFTSRHYWEVGALDYRESTGWLGRLLDIVGDSENAMQGLSLDGNLQPSLATARVPVSTLSSPSDYGFRSHHVWDVVGELMEDAVGGLGALAKSPDPTLAKASATAGQANQLRRQLQRLVGKDGEVKLNEKVGYPENDFGRRLAGLAAMLDRGFPVRAVAHGPGRLRHARRPVRPPARRPEHGRRGPRGVPARPRAARPRGPGADPRLERVRPPGGAERGQRDRPRRRRHRLPDRDEGAREGGRRVVRAAQARPRRQPARDLGLPRRLQLAPRAVVPGRRGACGPGREEDAPLQARRMRALALLLALGAVAAALGASAQAASAPQRIQVTEDEWSLVLSRQRLRPGVALVEVFNIGQDAHDLVLQRKAKGAKPVRVPKLDHFMRKTVRVKLAAGAYALWCSLPRHRERGMTATLRVR